MKPTKAVSIAEKTVVMVNLEGQTRASSIEAGDLNFQVSQGIELKWIVCFTLFLCFTALPTLPKAVAACNFGQSGAKACPADKRSIKTTRLVL